MKPGSSCHAPLTPNLSVLRLRELSAPTRPLCPSRHTFRSARSTATPTNCLPPQPGLCKRPLHRPGTVLGGQTLALRHVLYYQSSAPHLPSPTLSTTPQFGLESETLGLSALPCGMLGIQRPALSIVTNTWWLSNPGPTGPFRPRLWGISPPVLAGKAPRAALPAASPRPHRTPLHKRSGQSPSPPEPDSPR